MSNLNISERRVPQDGRITYKVANRQVDLRVSTLPTQFGESVVLRVLDRAAVNLDLDTLGFPQYLHDYVARGDSAAQRNHACDGADRLGQDDDALFLHAAGQHD